MLGAQFGGEGGSCFAFRARLAVEGKVVGINSVSQPPPVWGKVYVQLLEDVRFFSCSFLILKLFLA
jgi:hypothetical protein